MTDGRNTTELPDDFIELLGCPRCLTHPEKVPADQPRGKLTLTREQDAAWLLCEQCGRRYPIEDGIPNLLLDAAVGPEDDATAT